MSYPLSLRKAFKPVVLLLTCLIMTGCYSLKPVTLNSIPQKRNLLVVHADTVIWTVEGYTISDGILSARICPDTTEVRNKNSAHIYIAPIESVSVEETTLSVPVTNIARTEYLEINEAATIGFVLTWALVGFTLLLFL